MSGAAGLSAAKRRRAGSDFSNKPVNRSTPNQRSTPANSREGQVDLNNPNAILAIHDRLLHNHINATNDLANKLNLCLQKLEEQTRNNAVLEKKNRVLSNHISGLDKRLKQLEQVEKLREGHVDDASVDSDNDVSTSNAVSESNDDLANLSNVSFSVKEQ